MSEPHKSNGGSFHLGRIEISPRITVGNIASIIIFALVWYGGQVHRDDKVDALTKAIAEEVEARKYAISIEAEARKELSKHVDAIDEKGTNASRSSLNEEKGQINRALERISNIESMVWPMKEQVNKLETNNLWLTERIKPK